MQELGYELFGLQKELNYVLQYYKKINIIFFVLFERPTKKYVEKTKIGGW